MSDNSYNEKAIYLHMTELIVLLQGQDINDVLIFEELASANLSDREVANACASLVRKGILVTDERKVFLLREDLKPLFDLLKLSRQSCILYGHMMCIPMQIIYFLKDAAVAMQQDELRDNYYRLSYMRNRELLEQITSYDFLGQAERTEQELLYPNEQVLEKRLENPAVEQDENVLLFMQFYHDRKPSKSLTVYRFPLQDALIWKSEGDEGWNVYAKEYLEKIVLEFSHDNR